MRQIYLDNAATTRVDPRVKKTMDKFFSQVYGNPSSFNPPGFEAKKALDEARESVAKNLGCDQREVIFAGGGTESINLAIKGATLANRKNGRHIITSKIEHHAVLESCKWLEGQGFEITYLKPSAYGIINPDQVEEAIRKDTVLVSVMYANNEVGSINPIKRIASICKKGGVLFHTDACQATYLDLNVKNLGADLMTLNGSKMYGPKGVGILYKREGANVEPLLHGGGQEFGMRSGTENVPAIVGFAKALELLEKYKKKEAAKLGQLKDRLISGLLKTPNTHLNGHPILRLPNNANITFKGVDGESLLLSMGEKGIYASAGSACAYNTMEASHVLLGMGLSEKDARSSIRFSLGRFNTAAEINYAVKTIPTILKELR